MVDVYSSIQSLIQRAPDPDSCTHKRCIDIKIVLIKVSS